MNKPRRENQIFAYAKTKAKISFTVTANLIRAFVFATWIVQFLFFLNPKSVSVIVSDLVGNPEDRFSRVAAQIIMEHRALLLLSYYMYLTDIWKENTT